MIHLPSKVLWRKVADIEFIFIAFIVGIVLAAIFFVVSVVGDSQRKKQVGVALSQESAEFAPTKSHSSPSGGIAVDTEKGLIRLARATRDGTHARIFHSADIIEIQIHDSGNIVAQSGGGVVGAIAGPVGLGYLSSSKKKVAVRVSLVVFVDDSADPTWEVNFGNLTEVDASTGETIRNHWLSEAREWYGILKSLTRLESKSDLSSTSVQLRELADLYEKGLLDEAEFRSAKSRILGADSD